MSYCYDVIHNENTIENYRQMGRRLGRLLYEGRGSSAGADVTRTADAMGWLTDYRRGDDPVVAEMTTQF